MTKDTTIRPGAAIQGEQVMQYEGMSRTSDSAQQIDNQQFLCLLWPSLAARQLPELW